MTLTYGSLFSGIGGFDLGFDRAGMECRWQVEIDPFCQQVLAKHWPSVARYSDIKECGAHNLEPIDLICGGFPCQPISTAGLQKGIEDERWLWPEFERIICELRPRWIVVENVSAILWVNAGAAIREVLGGLAKNGYDAEWNCISAAEFGAPHYRERFFLIAYPAGQRRQRILRGHIQRFQKAYLLWHKPGPLDTPSDVLERIEQELGQPAVFGSDDGFPNRVDRLRALGNAIIPQVAEWIGNRIVEIESDARQE